jgi:hypothetical protein
MKRKTEMISITRKQRDYLEKNGCIFGEDIHGTHSRVRHYFAVESTKVKSLLKQYEEEIKPKN